MPRCRHPTPWSLRRASGGVGIARSPGEQHWTERASALLSPLLHAAAIESLPMRTVLRWIDRHDGATPLQILSRTVGEDATATDLLSGIVGTDAAGTVRHLVHRVGRPGGLPIGGRAGVDRAPSARCRRVLSGRQHHVHLLRRSPAAPVRSARRRRPRRCARRHLRPGAVRRATATHIARSRRGGQHRAHSRPARPAERGGRTGSARDGVPAGPVPGPRPLGIAADGFLTLFGTTVVFPGSPTSARCATSAPWPATTRCPRRPWVTPWANGDASGPRARSAPSGCHDSRST